MEAKRVKTCVPIQAEAEPNRRSNQAGELRSGFPADRTAQEIADQGLAILLAQTRNRDSIRCHNTDSYLAAGSTICVQPKLSPLKSQGFREQMAGGRPRRLGDEAMAQESYPADTAHASSSLDVFVTHVEATIVHPDLVSSGDHSHTHVDHAAVEGALRTRTQESGAVGSVPADAVTAGSDLDLQVVGVMVVGRRKPSRPCSTKSREMPSAKG